MISTLNLQVSNPALNLDSSYKFAASPNRTPRLPSPHRRFVSLCLRKPDSVSFTHSAPSASNLTASIGSPPPSIQLSQWTLSQRHFLILNYIACTAFTRIHPKTVSLLDFQFCMRWKVQSLPNFCSSKAKVNERRILTAVSATLLFCAAIPTLLAFKRAAESVEKLLDVTREELPGTMAAIRLSGMEISDLTMELSDLGQGITQGVKSSTRVVHAAKESLRRITNRTPSASLQEVVPVEKEVAGLVIARKARGMREGIVKSRAMVQLFFTLTRFTRMAFGFFSSQSKS